MYGLGELAQLLRPTEIAGRSIALKRPAAGLSEQYRVAPSEVLDLTQIAGENITMVKLGSRLVILFPDKAFIVVDGLYLPDGAPSSDVNVALDASTTVNGTQFVAQFPITTDEQFLTAAGINVGPRGAGGINLAAALPGSALSVLSDLTPDLNQGGSTFDPLQPSTSTGSNGVAGNTTPPGVLPPPLSPIASSDLASATEAGVNPGNTSFSGTPVASGNVTSNDVLSSAVTVTGVALGVTASASGNVGSAVTGVFGNLMINADGSYSYTLDNADADTQALAQGVTVVERFTYTITDAFGQSSTAVLTVSITGTNDAPVITGIDFNGSVVEGSNGGEEEPPPAATVATGTLTATDVDTGAVLTWSGSATGAYGSISVTSGGTWTYTLDEGLANSLAEGQTDTDSFIVTVQDEFGATSTQLVTITVTGTNDAPTIDLDTTTSGSGYQGLTAAEAAASTSVISAANGVSIVQTDDNGAASLGSVLVSDPDTIDRFSHLSAFVGGTSSGSRGVLVLEPSVAAAFAGVISISGDGTLSININSAGGLTAGEMQTILSGLRYVNTETTFAMSTADRLITISVTDDHGATTTETARIPVIAHVSDTTGLDAFTGTRFDDIIDGLGGNDVIDGGAGNNTIYGGDGNDTLRAGDGNNIVEGNAGDDSIMLGDGNNTVSGGIGDDYVLTGIGNDIIDGGADDNTILAGDGNNTVTAGDGANAITTGLGIDFITTGAGDDTINAGDGDNTILAGAGDNTITTGGGIDTITTGLTGDNVIDSGAGNDTIVTGDGDDIITTGAGDDKVTSGDGNDTFVLNADLSTLGLDSFTDFQSGADTFEINHLFAGSGLAQFGLDAGTLDASRFTTGTSFTNTDQRFMFNTSDNTLYFDADGSGVAESAIALAHIENGDAVSAGDIRLT